MPIVAVLGATVDEPPPGIDPAASLAELRYAATAEEVAGAIAEADAVFSWGAAACVAPRRVPDGRQAAVGPVRQRRGRRVAVPGARRRARSSSRTRGACSTTRSRSGRSARWSRSRPGLQRVDRRSAGRAIGPTGAVATPVAGRNAGRGRPGPDRARRRAARAGPRHAGERGRARAADDDALRRRSPDPKDSTRRSADADIVLDALPLTAATERSVDAAAFAAMTTARVLRNVGRGRTVDEGALIEALRDGAIGRGGARRLRGRAAARRTRPCGRCPTSSSRPTCAATSRAGRRTVVAVFVDNLRRFVRGRAAPQRRSTSGGLRSRGSGRVRDRGRSA